MADDRKPKLVPLPERREGELLAPASTSALRPRDLRRRILAASFALCVLLPSLLGVLYYAFVASDRYVAGAGFAVRGMDGGSGVDLLGSFTGLASNGSTTSDSYILLKYLESRDIVENLEADFPFRQSYGTDDADILSRMDPDLEIEQVVEYWQRRIHTAFDNTSGIITFEVEAFTPQDARHIAALVLDYSKALVNELSRQARNDAVAYANMEVERAEERLKAALDSVRRFREDERALDPASSARIQLELIGNLEKQLAEYRARIAALRETVDVSSPSLRNLIRQAEALEAQIAAQRSETSAPDEASGGALTGQLATFETLEVERNFAQQAYTSALSSLEKARVEADRQQRYLAVYSTPAVPQYPLYPRRVLNSFLIFAGLSLIWGIGTLIVYAVRDHVS
ncbi:capsular polysaccharide transport system permease protein [Mesorhizobium sp. J18]|uniref:lipopolysaccharide biosynthesis protein n=1 Tax=Mesorhizobium sp. J18 TaxID=935263 RepID=UPI00119A8813|nr:lipopolysaccharide biosynthesis protein [Mesorhizobium sp. J18]TWG99905.1 capsular polysaccharide transport system permease protein [Mesorhizobium sp. J18]